MGAFSAWIFERGDAGRLIDVGARGQPCIDVGYDEDTVLPGVKIGVENAITATELQLEARPFLDLQGWPPEMGSKVTRRHSGQAGRLSLLRSDLRRLFGHGRRCRPRGAGRKEKG